MKSNNQNTKSIYINQLITALIFQSVLWLIILVGLEAIYLYGSNSFLRSDISYIGIISVLLTTLFIQSKSNNLIYWKLRPKLSLFFFQNISNIFIIIFISIVGFSIYTNVDRSNFSQSIGMFEAITLMLSLPFAFYIWLSLQRSSKMSTAYFIESETLTKYQTIEPYIFLVFFSIYGIVYDYIPQNFNYLILGPTVSLSVCILIGLVLNFYILNRTKKLAQLSSSEEKVKKIINSFEITPYQYINMGYDTFNGLNDQEQLIFIAHAKSLCLIDKIEEFENWTEDVSVNIKNELNDVIDFLKSLEKQIEAIDNIYEYVEQSNNYSVLRAIVRKQAVLCDKNLLIKLLNDNRPLIAKSACLVAGLYDDINFISLLINHLENPKTSIYAQFALKKIGFKSVKYLEIEFSKRRNNMFFVEACFEILSFMREKDAHQLLFSSLSDQNKTIVKIAAKKIIKTYDKADENKRIYFSDLFNDLIISTVSNYLILEQIEKLNQTFYQLKRAFQDENQENILLIESLMKLYYDDSTVTVIFKQLGKNDISSHLLAFNLIDILVNDNLEVSNKLKALFSPKDSRIKEYLLEEYPSFNFEQNYRNEEDLIWAILNKDYREMNNWTRACAINTLQYLYSDDIPFELAAEFLNANTLLKETAALCIYKNIPEFYTIFLNRLDKKEASNIDYIVRSNVENTKIIELRHDNLLLYKKIEFLASIPYLKELTTNEINTFHSFFKPIVLEEGNHEIDLNTEDYLGFWIIESGKINISFNGMDYIEYEKRDIVEVSAIAKKSKKLFVRIDSPVRILLIEKIILLNLLKNSYDIIWDSVQKISDFSSILNFVNYQNNKVA